MQHLRPGELVALEHGGRYYVFLVLSTSAFFGCRWTLALYETRPRVPEPGEVDIAAGDGFVALIDFIEPRRADAVIRIDKGRDVDGLLSFPRMKAMIRNPGGSALWYIYDRRFEIVETKPSLSDEDLDYPIASGMHATDAFELVDARWSPRVLVSPSDEGQFPRGGAVEPSEGSDRFPTEWSHGD